MIGASKNREALADIQHGIAALDSRLTRLADRHADLVDQQKILFDQQAVLSNQQAADTERRAGEALHVAQLVARIVELEAIVASQAALLASYSEALAHQGAKVASLCEAEETRDETVKQLQGDVGRIGRQAVIDLNEMRETSNAIAAALLLPSSAVDPVRGDARPKL